MGHRRRDSFMNLGSPLAGEALYKVWTQESFPIEIRASIQGFINGFSACAVAVRRSSPGSGAS